MTSPNRPPFYRDERVQRILGQVIFVLFIVILFAWLGNNMLTGLRRQGISLGLDFLNNRAGFDISETRIAYDSDSTMGRAFLAGLINTIYVSILGIILASFAGLIIGIAQLSGNILIRNIFRGYVELMRNMPLLVYLIFLYFGVFVGLPKISEAMQIGPTLWSNRGVGLPWVINGQLSIPVLEGRNITGGILVSPEFMTLLLGLVSYTAAFIGEIVRTGIQSVGKGQIEAAKALGLSTSQTLRLVVLPQALRVMIPPLTSTYLNLTKNSSLAGAVAYPDLVSNANTIINQTGRAVESIFMVMLIYLSLSLITSAFMNWYNHKVRLIER
ncbi:MAG: ABC transporter permease subunit [Chloroflexota bacterium]|nr:ABC transporter permease subunit [Chloroflexota bacterium]